MARIRRVRQTLADPAGHRDWVVEAVVDLDATDAAGELGRWPLSACVRWRILTAP